MLSFAIRGVAAGDVTGDGQPKIVVIDQTRLRVYRWDGSALVPLWEDQENTSASYLAVDVADINDNGIAEIFVTNLETDRLASFVVEWRDGKFRRVVEDMNVFFRVVGQERRRPVLLGQQLNRTAENPFQSTIERFTWDGRTYRPKRLPGISNGLNVYAMNFLDATQDAVLTLNTDGTLALLHNGEIAWVSADIYDNPAVLFTVRTERSESMLFKPGHGEGSIQQRLLYIDLGRNGDRMLVTSRPVRQPDVVNYRPGRQRTQRTELAFLTWNNGTFVELGRIPSVDGTIIDYQVADLDGDGIPELILAVRLGSGLLNLFEGDRSAVIVHPLPGEVLAAR